MKEVAPSPLVKISKDVSQGVLPGYEEEVAAQLTDKKEQELREFFTNPSGRVSAIIPGPRDITAATLTARFSRAEEPDFAELFWKEFREKLGGDVVQRILNEYGDDSVREDASGYLTVKGVSVLTSMQIFQHPLITGIEASTRYINWGNLPEEDFAVRPEKIMQDPEAREIYLDAIRTSYENYKQLWPVVWSHLVLKNPRAEGQSEGAYKRAVKGAVCDALRGLLTLGAKTSVGIHANYRALSEMIMNLRASDFSETREVADEMAVESKKVNPVFMAVVDNEHGLKWTEYQKRANEILKDFGRTGKRWINRDNNDLSVQVQVLNKNWLGDLHREAVVFRNGNLSDYENWELNREFSYNKLESLLKTLSEARYNRRDKVPSFVNIIALRVNINNLSFGSFKDFNRQRFILTKSEPDWSGKRGFIIPEVIKECGRKAKDLYIKTQEKMIEAKKKLEEKYPEESKLLLTHGMKTSVEMVMGLGEDFWIEELRSLASNAPENRKIAIGLYHGTVKEVPMLSILGKFVDQNEYTLGRIGEAVRADLKGK